MSSYFTKAALVLVVLFTFYAAWSSGQANVHTTSVATSVLAQTKAIAQQNAAIRRISQASKDQAQVNANVLSEIQQSALARKQANLIVQSCSTPGRPCYQRELRIQIALATCINRQGSLRYRDMVACLHSIEKGTP